MRTKTEDLIGIQFQFTIYSNHLRVADVSLPCLIGIMVFPVHFYNDANPLRQQQQKIHSEPQ